MDRYAYHSRYTPDQDRDTSDDGSVSSGNRQKIFDTVQSFFRVYNPVSTEDVRRDVFNQTIEARQDSITRYTRTSAVGFVKSPLH